MFSSISSQLEGRATKQNGEDWSRVGKEFQEQDDFDDTDEGIDIYLILSLNQQATGITQATNGSKNIILFLQFFNLSNLSLLNPHYREQMFRQNSNHNQSHHLPSLNI